MHRPERGEEATEENDRQARPIDRQKKDRESFSTVHSSHVEKRKRRNGRNRIDRKRKLKGTHRSLTLTVLVTSLQAAESMCC